jgi:hypothetical protein
MDERGEENVEEPLHPLADDAIEDFLGDPRPSLMSDVTFGELPGGFEISYSDRLANDHRELVDQSADWLENEMGVLNLGQIDHKMLIADGILTNEIKNGLIVWWTERVEDLDLE